MSNFEQYLREQQDKTLLRFITCGSVDDGKSTLIGRLLYDSKAILEDQLRSLEVDSEKSGSADGKLDFSLLVDGLQSEREQSITIDVAYRYFSTDKRKYIIADTPGHEQYTRNMATGASTAELAVILIDARKGVLTQTRRHSYIATLLGIKHILVAVNKMDLVGFEESVFNKIKQDYTDIVKLLPNYDSLNVTFVPICALNGDNVVLNSPKMLWYKGSSIIEYLDGVVLSYSETICGLRFPVQYVNRPNPNFRGYCGTIASGKIQVGDEIVILPSRKTSKIKSIITPDIKNLSSLNNDESIEYANVAMAGMSITITLEDEIDISRGDMITSTTSLPHIADSFDAMVVWMSQTTMKIGTKYIIKRSSTTVFGSVVSVVYKKEINSFDKTTADSLALNDIARCSFVLNSKIAFDTYRSNRETGSFIIIDRYSNETLGAGMIVDIGSMGFERKHSKLEILLNRFIRKQFPHWEAKDISGSL